MSTVAIENLRSLWGDLVFARITRVIGRDPEDVLYIHINKYNPTVDGKALYRTGEYREIKSKLLKDIPDDERKFASVAWKHYYGFAVNSSFPNGIYFSNSRYAEIDFDIHMSLDLCGCGNHSSGSFRKPKIDQWICGRIEDSPKGGKRFTEWFCVDKQTKKFIEFVQSGKCNLTEEQLAYDLVGGACGFPDNLWAIARLVFFDNVQAFFKLNKGEQTEHPCKGFIYGHCYPEGYDHEVTWGGMYLSTADYDSFVHTLSCRLDPDWWNTFKNLRQQINLSISHDQWCVGCHLQSMSDHDDEFYDY